MPPLRALVFCLGLLCPTLSHAGPWMRESGQTFLSYSVETDLENGLTDGSGLYGSLYVEHGLTQNLTLGFDAGADDSDMSKAIAFLRWPLGAKPRATLMAFEMGLGMADDDFALRPGVSLGKGFQASHMPGWVSLDARALMIGGFQGRIEADVTFGLSPTPNSKVIMQLQTGFPDDRSAYAKLAPSYVHQIAPGRHLELGLVAGIAEADDFKLKLGLWHQF